MNINLNIILYYLVYTLKLFRYFVFSLLILIALGILFKIAKVLTFSFYSFYNFMGYSATIPSMIVLIGIFVLYYLVIYRDPFKDPGYSKVDRVHQKYKGKEGVKFLYPKRDEIYIIDKKDISSKIALICTSLIILISSSYFLYYLPATGVPESAGNNIYLSIAILIAINMIMLIISLILSLIYIKEIPYLEAYLRWLNKN